MPETPHPKPNEVANDIWENEIIDADVKRVVENYRASRLDKRPDAEKDIEAEIVKKNIELVIGRSLGDAAMHFASMTGRTLMRTDIYTEMERDFLQLFPDPALEIAYSILDRLQTERPELSSNGDFEEAVLEAIIQKIRGDVQN